MSESWTSFIKFQYFGALVLEDICKEHDASLHGDCSFNARFVATCNKSGDIVKTMVICTFLDLQVWLDVVGNSRGIIQSLGASST